MTLIGDPKLGDADGRDRCASSIVLGGYAQSLSAPAEH